MKTIILVLTIISSMANATGGGSGGTMHMQTLVPSQVSDQVTVARFKNFQGAQTEDAPVINTNWVCTAEGQDSHGAWTNVTAFGDSEDDATLATNDECFKQGLNYCNTLSCAEQK